MEPDSGADSVTSIAELIAMFGGKGEVGRTLAVGSLIAARVTPLTVLAPFLATRAAPATVRTAIVLALTVAFVPIAMQSAAAVHVGAPYWPLMIARELSLGLIFALAVALPFYALDWTGHLTDIWRGASMSEVMSPTTGEQTSPLGQLYLFVGIVLFVTLGGLRFSMIAFADSLQTAPIGALTLGSDFSSWGLGIARLSGSALALSAAMAAPAAVAIVLVEFGLGLIARSAPQVPVYFAGMPLRAATGLAVVLLAISVTIDGLPRVFSDAVEQGAALLRTIGR
ncbi:MAG: flagellar biosynthetic protein FliR [Polyangiales bacterium]